MLRRNAEILIKMEKHYALPRNLRLYHQEGQELLLGNASGGDNASRTSLGNCMTDQRGCVKGCG